MKKLLVLAGFLLIAIGGWWIYKSKNQGLILNPLSFKENKTPKINQNYKVIGFLPTWNVNKTINYCEEISDLVFLGIEVEEDGDLVWDTQSKKIFNQTYIEQRRNFKECGGKNILGIKLFDDNKIRSLMASESAKRNLIEQVQEVALNNNFDGINIDFEYQGDPVAILGEELFQFINELKKTYRGKISVDVFANTIIKGNDEEIRRMVNNIDELIVMAYDFHRPGMDYAGPVAPINSPAGERNILEVTDRVVGLGLSKKKIILAYPLYGYEWKTVNADYGSRVKRGWYALASYKRMKELEKDTRFKIYDLRTSELEENKLLEEKEMRLYFDKVSMSPWLTYKENGEIYQIYYENLESLIRKFDVVKESQMGGVGFWALGYEGTYGDVWQEAKKILE